MSLIPQFLQDEFDKINSLYEVPVVGGALRGADFLQRSTIDAGAGLLGIGLQKVAEGLGGGRGREEQAVTSAVTAETDKIDNPLLRAAATPFLYGAAASEAKRIAQQRADLPAVELGPVRLDALDIAEFGLPATGLIGAAAKAPAAARLVTRGAATPKGAIATRIDELAAQGLNEQQAFTVIQHEFGQAKAMEFATTGNDVFIAAPPVSAAAPQVGTAAVRAAGQIGETPQTYEQGARLIDDFRPTEVGPKMGSGKPGENLGVNLEKIDAPQETKDYIKQVADENAGFVEQRRGVVTTAETQAMADRVEVDAQKYAFLKPGTALNAEQLKAVADAMVAKGNEVTRLQEAIRTERAAGVVSKETQLRLLAAAAEHQTLQRVFAGVRAESGRALRIQREIADGLRRSDINGTYDRAVELFGGKANADELIDKLQKVWTDPNLTPIERDVAVFKMVKNLDQATGWDKIQELWINSILSAPVTHTTNILGQPLLQLADMGTGLLTAAIEVPAAAIGRRPRERYFSEAWASITSLGDGFRRARAKMRDADERAATKFRETGDMGRRQAIGGKVGDIVNLPTKALGVEDLVFRSFAEARAIHETAYRIASREGLRGPAFTQRAAELITNPTDEMKAAAKTMGERASLRQPPGKITRLALQARDVVSIGGFKPLRHAIPFITTPVNLVKVGAEYSPLGFVRSAGLSGGARSEAMARALLGSSAMGLLAQQFAAGNITAGPPRDPAERDLFYASGKIPYAVKLGDKWVSFQRLEPVSTPLKWTAALMQQAQENPDQPFDVVASKMVFALARQMEDSTYLSGLSDLIDALQDPTKADKFLGRIASGFVPRAVSTAVNSSDPYIRDPKGIGQQILAALPYFHEQVPVKQTALGPAERSEGKQGVSGFISPVDFNIEVQDPERDFISKYKLPEALGPDGNLLPARSLNVGEVAKEIASLRLTDEEGRRYQQLAGEATRNLLRELREDRLLYEDKQFSTLQYEDQVRAIRKTISDAREVARAQAADEFMSVAKNDGQVARAAVMRLSTIGKTRDRARYLEGLDLQGRLTPQAQRLIDQRPGDDPPVREMVKAVPLINEYVNTPPYTIGDPAEWERMRKARSAADKYAKETGKPEGVADWQWYFEVDPEGALLIRLYSRQSLRSRKRTDMLRQNPWLERYVRDA